MEQVDDQRLALVEGREARHKVFETPDPDVIWPLPLTALVEEDILQVKGEPIPRDVLILGGHRLDVTIDRVIEHREASASHEDTAQEEEAHQREEPK